METVRVAWPAIPGWGNRANALTQRTAPTFRWERWRKPVLLGLAVLNFVLIGWLLNLQEWRGAADWRVWAELDPANPYTIRPDGWMPFRYSPVAGYLLHWASIVGPVGFVIGHFAVLLALPRKLGLIVALSVPFWFDLLWGNVFTLVFVAAWWALQPSRVDLGQRDIPLLGRSLERLGVPGRQPNEGEELVDVARHTHSGIIRHRIGVLAYIALTLLMPRPVQLPLLTWLLWKEPWVRLPFVALFLGHAGLVLLSGVGQEWITALVSSTAETGVASNFGGSRLFSGWLIVGVPLALVLFRKHPAWAGLALSPYLLGQYWLFALLGFGRSQSDDQRGLRDGEVKRPGLPAR